MFYDHKIPPWIKYNDLSILAGLNNISILFVNTIKLVNFAA